MFLKDQLKLKKKSEIPYSRFLKKGIPWVFANELQKFDSKIPAGSWVGIATAEGEPLGYGFFNPHSLIAFRLFERVQFRNEEALQENIMNRLDAAWRLRQSVYAGSRSVRLVFGESDALAGLIIDLFESTSGEGIAVIQCHAAGADYFIPIVQRWLESRLKIKAGLIRNDLDVRRREQVELYTKEWGVLPSETFAREGDLRFFFDLKAGQKTGFFYDHRDNRLAFAKRAAALAENNSRPTLSALDCFSYVGAWGLGLAKANKKIRVVCLDVSDDALQMVTLNAQENGLSDRVEIVSADFFKDRSIAKKGPFDIVVSDPPAMSASAKHSDESRKAHERCFFQAMGYLSPGGIAALAACSYHLKWDEFIDVCARAGQSRNRQLSMTHIGSQSADHPMLANMPETVYLKCVFVQELGV